MSEADLITVGFMGIETRMLLWGTELTLIFGYLAALYFFLRHTSKGFRTFTFSVFLMTMIFMWLGFAGTDIGSERYFEARFHTIAQGQLPPYSSNELAPRIRLLLAAASLLGHALHAVAISGGRAARWHRLRICCFIYFSNHGHLLDGRYSRVGASAGRTAP